MLCLAVDSDLATLTELNKFKNLQKIRFYNNDTITLNFDQPLVHGKFPDSLTSLKFSQNFNQPLSNGVLPQNLKKLKFGYSSL